MAQAAEKITEEINIQKRFDKALRAQGYKGNLIAFSRALRADKSLGRTAVERYKAMQPTEANLAFASNAERNDRLSNMSELPDQGNSDAQQFNLPGLPISGVMLGNFHLSPKRTLIAAVVGALAVGGILGSVWSIAESQSAARNNTLASTDPATGVEPAPTPDTTVAAVTPAQPAQELVTRNNELQTQVKGFVEEIDWLNEQNTDLEQKVEALTNETIDLNAELLELELEIAGSQPVEESRVVYNFVNVPIGGESASNQNYENYPEPVVYEPVVYEEDNVYGDDEFLERELYAESVEYQEAYGYPEDDEPVYDPETGLYLSPDMLVGDGVQQFDNGRRYIQPDTQVIYPPVAPDSY